MTPNAGARLATVRADTDRVCQMLLHPTPQQLDRCSELLAGAVSQMTACRDAVRSLPADPNGPTRAEAQRLQRSIRRAERLLAGAAEFHSGWIRYLGGHCAGYTAQGEPAAVPRVARLCARG